MRKLLEQSKFLAWIAVIGLLVTAILAFLAGVGKIVAVFMALGASYGVHPMMTLYLIRVADAFLVATALLVFAIGLYELFIGPLSVPDWMLVRSLFDLEVKLAGVIVLVMAVKFLEKLIEGKSAEDTLYTALAVGVVSIVLVIFQNSGPKSK